MSNAVRRYAIFVLFVLPGLADNLAARHPCGCRSGSVSSYPVAPAMQYAQTPSLSVAPGAAAPSDFDLASSLDVAKGPQTIVPNMIGDMFGHTGSINLNIGGSAIVSDVIGVGGRRVKIAENNSPMPRDRIYHVYNHFHKALHSRNDLLGSSRDFNVDRFTFGAEKTFYGGITSVEVRIPFANTLESNTMISPSSVPGSEGFEFGNIWFGTKTLLYETRQLAVSAGVGTVLPTADNALIDASAVFAPGSYVRIDNDTVSLSPFAGLLCVPSERVFMQTMLQTDIPINGNDVYWDLGTGNQNGSLNEQALILWSFDIGYWVYRNPCSVGLTGIAPIVEVHYTSTLQDADRVTMLAGVADVGNLSDQFATWNTTMGITFEIANRSTLTTALVLPLNDDDNRQFDAELNVQLNYFFGPRTRSCPY